MTNVAAEKLLIAGLIRHPDKFFEYSQYLGDDDFNDTASRMTYQILHSLYIDRETEKVSKAKLVAEAKALGHGNYLSVTKNGGWIDDVLIENVAEGEVGETFLEVKRQALIAKYLDASEEVRDYLKTTSDPLSTIISNVEDAIISKVTMLDRGERSIQYLTLDARAKIEALADDPGHVGLDIGYPIWQSRVGQIRNGSVTFIVGTTGSGKSQLGLRAALEAAHRKRLPVLLLDSELNKEDQLVRVVAQFAEIPYEIIETGYWKMSDDELRAEGVEPEELEKIAEYKRRLCDDRYWEIVEKLPIEYLSVSGMGVQEAIPHIRRWLLTRVKPDKEAKHPECLIVYDYIKLATLDEIQGGRVAEWQMHGLNVAALHDLVARYNVPCIAFGQTNNEIDEGIKCVAGGKRISENVTSVSYFKRKTDDERTFDGDGSHLVRIFKARYGRGTPNNTYINYQVDLSFGQFNELSLGTVNFNEARRRRQQEERERARNRRSNDDED